MNYLISVLVALALGTGLPASASETMSLFDAHLHYSGADAEQLTPEQVIDILDRNRVACAIVSSTPNAGTDALYRHAPARIIPFLSLYRTRADLPDWPLDKGLPARVEAALDQGMYRGIGELHIFADHRRSPVFRQVVAIAQARGLWLHVHGDPAVIDAAFEYAPEARILWAHAGTQPYPWLLSDYLGRYANLYVDLSVREDAVAPEGTLHPEWRALFLAYPDRFLIGVDTFSTSRWKRFDAIVAQVREWLGQLPEDIAVQLGRGNGQRLFGANGLCTLTC